jgi:glycosyltransferase involved in cell wall biosynthesis
MLQPQAVRRGRLRKSVAYQLLERANLRGAALLHATSEQEADALRDLQLGVPIAVVPNGVDLESAQSAARGYRERLGIPPDAFVVLYLGRMHRIKRLDLLADAFDDLRRTHTSAHLVLAGHDEQGLVPGLMRRLSPTNHRTDRRGGRARQVGAPPRRGRDRGVLRKEFAKLTEWLADEPVPDVVNLPNSLLIGLARPLREILKRPVCCTLQGEDLFLEGLVEPYRTKAIDLIRRQVQDVDCFLSVSDYYAPVMSRLYAALL